MKNKETKRKKKIYPRLSRRTDAVVTGQVKDFDDSYAVLLRYRDKKDDAPFIFAKSKGKEALSLLDVAQKVGIHIEREYFLAESLYVDINDGEYISEIYYDAVAKIYAKHVISCLWDSKSKGNNFYDNIKHCFKVSLITIELFIEKATDIIKKSFSQKVFNLWHWECII